MHQIRLSPEEEKLAQLLTRDAWVHFSEMISQRDLFHVKEIPMMPRFGLLELPMDVEIIQYYVDFAQRYTEELALRGWDQATCQTIVESFISRIESTTGIGVGMGDTKVAAS